MNTLVKYRYIRFAELILIFQSNFFKIMNDSNEIKKLACFLRDIFESWEYRQFFSDH